MSFVALMLLLMGITLLYAAYMDASPLLVARAFIEHKELSDYATE
jgi:hypothetical protein